VDLFTRLAIHREESTVQVFAGHHLLDFFDLNGSQLSPMLILVQLPVLVILEDVPDGPTARLRPMTI